MKKGKKVLIFLIVGALCIGCLFAVQRFLWTKYTPDILFIYSKRSDSSQNEYRKSYIFDKQGNIYLYEKDAMYYEDMLEKYASGELLQEMSYVGSVNVNMLQLQYSHMRVIAAVGEPMLFSSGSGPSVLCWHKSWAGIYYDKEGKPQYMELFEVYNDVPFCLDWRVYSIVDWMNSKTGEDRQVQTQ